MVRRLLGKWAGGGARSSDDPAAGAGRRPEHAPAAAARAGVSVHAAAAVAALGPSPARPGATRLGPADGVEPGSGLSWAAVVLSGDACGDLVVSGAGGLGLPPGTPSLLDGVPAGEGDAPARVPREALTGTAVPGVTGARLLYRTAARDVLRFGPPPGARWAVAGLRSVAVFAGKLTLLDGDEGHDVRAGEVAFVSDPSATLHVVAGNDAAVAVGFAAPGVGIHLR